MLCELHMQPKVQASFTLKYTEFSGLRLALSQHLPALTKVADRCGVVLEYMCDQTCTYARLLA